jgi:tRNA threonylcarbamoyladenosine biosynthesis protein TsaE
VIQTLPPQILTTTSQTETEQAGTTFARDLTAGSVVLLQGELGAGKTAFVRGIAKGLGSDPDDVSSPTFTLIQEYRGGRVPLFHADLYRLDNPREIDDLGLDDIAADGVLAIEWSEKLPRTPRGAILVRIDHGEGDVRTITLIGS